MNTSQRLVVAVWTLALLAMFAYPPLVHTKAAGYGLTKWAYGWLWQDGSIDMARLGIQCFLFSGVAGLLAYVLRPAGIQAIAKRKKLVFFAIAKKKKLVIFSAVFFGIVGGMVFLSLRFDLWERAYWWWDKLPPAQVSKISVEDPNVNVPEWMKGDPLVAHQEIRLVVKNGSEEALRAISIRVYYPGVAAPSVYDRLMCSDSANGKTEVTIEIEHEYVPPLRIEVLEAWRSSGRIAPAASAVHLSDGPAGATRRKTGWR